MTSRAGFISLLTVAVLSACAGTAHATPTLTFTLEINDNGNGVYSPNQWALYADDSVGDNYGLVSYQVPLVNTLTVNHVSPEATAIDTTGQQANVTAGFGLAFVRSGANSGFLTASIDTVTGTGFITPGFGQQGGDLLALPAQQGWNSASGVVQELYKAHLLLATGTYDPANTVAFATYSSNDVNTWVLANVLPVDYAGVYTTNTNPGQAIKVTAAIRTFISFLPAPEPGSLLLLTLALPAFLRRRRHGAP